MSQSQSPGALAARVTAGRGRAGATGRVACGPRPAGNVEPEAPGQDDTSLPGKAAAWTLNHC